LFSEPNAASWAELAQLLEDSNSMEYARRRAEEYTARARAELESLEDSTAKQLLEEITEFVADRSF
jgi:geranylgeranyl pyrophosphate synthase